MDTQTILFQFFGGLGIFLFGIQMMGDGLQRAAGDRLRDLLQRFTSTPLRAVITGTAITCLIQSSSGTTVLAVGLVSSGFMTLTQAIGVILGANIGTTITAFIIGINLGEYALPIVGVGSILMFFFKKPQIVHMGQVLLGFGLLFYGLELMGTGMEPLQEMDTFHNMMISMSHNPILGVGVGTGLTVIMQSSSATIGILQKLYMQGAVTLSAAIPIMLGDNIGTTITAVLASLTGNIAAKRTATAHVFIKIVGVAIFMVFLVPFNAIVVFLGERMNLNPAMQIAVAHGLFNVVNMLILFWFIPNIATGLVRFLPDKEDETDDIADSRLDEHILYEAGPTLALQQARQELSRLANIVKEQVDLSESYYFDKKESDGQRIKELEVKVNKIDKGLTDFLTLISSQELGLNDSDQLAAMLDISKYLERIGDHTVNMARDLTEAIRIDQDVNHFTERWGSKKIETMFALTRLYLADITTFIKTGKQDVAKAVIERGNEITELEQELRTTYLSLITSGKSQATDHILFIDTASNLERIGDHTIRMAMNHLRQLNIQPSERKESLKVETV